MAPLAPFIMPDGSKLSDVLRTERRREQRREGVASTGKQAQADYVHQLQVQAKSAAASGSADEHSLAELRALEAVGARRRRRWLNEKTLRDLAGPLSAADMTSLFHPAPFGHVHESPLQQISEDAAAAAVWDSFRSIDPDKERRVLDKWEQYNADLRKNSQRGASASSSAPPEPPSPAVVALKSWSLVNKGSRAALRKANVHSVLVLETQLIELVELRDTSGRLSLQIEDPFGRLLVHGLAQFHGLSSFSGKGSSAGEVTVHFRPEHQAQPEALPPPPEITCTDVLLALAELGGNGLTHDHLARFVRKHIHGVGSSSASEVGDWVMVP